MHLRNIRAFAIIAEIRIVDASCCVGAFVMRVLYGGSARRNIETARSIVDGDEQLFGSTLSQIARMLWPQKTAANLAAAANCSVRAAEFYLAGERDWSADALSAIVLEILKRHGMRNLRVKAK